MSRRQENLLKWSLFFKVNVNVIQCSDWVDNKSITETFFVFSVFTVVRKMFTIFYFRIRDIFFACNFFVRNCHKDCTFRLSVALHLAQIVQKWTKQNLWKTVLVCLSSNCLKAVFYRFYLVYSWVQCLNCSISSDKFILAENRACAKAKLSKPLNKHVIFPEYSRFLE